MLSILEDFSPAEKSINIFFLVYSGTPLIWSSMPWAKKFGPTNGDCVNEGSLQENHKARNNEVTILPRWL